MPAQLNHMQNVLEGHESVIQISPSLDACQFSADSKRQVADDSWAQGSVAQPFRTEENPVLVVTDLSLMVTDLNLTSQPNCGAEDATWDVLRSEPATTPP
eukprot:1672541-Amphidinium_carterae.1